MIRAFEPKDIEEAKRIHELYFKDRFDLPDFMDFLCAFIIEDEKGVILVGGVRDIPELITMTDQARSPMDRIKALNKGLDACLFFATQFRYKQLHCFVKDAKYARRLQRNFGFRPIMEQGLLIDV